MGLEQGTANTWASLIATPPQRSNGALPRGQRAAGRYRTASVAAMTPPGQRPAAPRQPLQRIVILSEPGLFADGLARSMRMLGAGVEVRVESPRDAADRLAQCALVIVDLEAAGDPQQAIDALRAKTTAPVVVLAHPDSDALLDAAMRAGAVALLPKSSTEAQMLEQIAGLLRQQPGPCEIVGGVRNPGEKTPAAREARPYGLTAGEMDVLRLLREGLTNAQIARERGSKEGTVKIHLDKIYKKLGVQNRTQAICIAARMDSLIDLQARRFQEADFRFEALSGYVTHEIRRAGEVLFSRGDPGDALYYVQKGRVQLVELGLTMEDGGLFGEIAIFSPGHVRTCTARCETPASLFRLSAEKAQRLYVENPRFAYHVVRLIAGRLIADRERTEGRTSLE